MRHIKFHLWRLSVNEVLQKEKLFTFREVRKEQSVEMIEGCEEQGVGAVANFNRTHFIVWRAQSPFLFLLCMTTGDLLLCYWALVYSGWSVRIFFNRSFLVLYALFQYDYRVNHMAIYLSNKWPNTSYRAFHTHIALNNLTTAKSGLFLIFYIWRAISLLLM